MASEVVGVTVSVPQPSRSLARYQAQEGGSTGGWELPAAAALTPRGRGQAASAWTTGGKGFPLHRGPSTPMGVGPSTRQLCGLGGARGVPSVSSGLWSWPTEPG